MAREREVFNQPRQHHRGVSGPGCPPHQCAPRSGAICTGSRLACLQWSLMLLVPGRDERKPKLIITTSKCVAPKAITDNSPM